jgi:YD repeat-containing protein
MEFDHYPVLMDAKISQIRRWSLIVLLVLSSLPSHAAIIKRMTDLSLPAGAIPLAVIRELDDDHQWHFNWDYLEQATDIVVERSSEGYTKGHITRLKGPRGAIITLEYDYHGNLVAARGSNSFVAMYSYQDRHLIEVHRYDPSGRIVDLRYDLRGKLIHCAIINSKRNREIDCGSMSR